MAETGSQVFVVANAADAARVAGWLRDDGLPGARTGDGGDDTLAALAAAPAEVVVLDAGIRSGDALAFAQSLHAAGPPRPQLVLIADEAGQVRHALDAVPFHADRFLRRPLSRSALLFAVKSCLDLGRADVAEHVRAPHAKPAATAAAFAALGDIAPAPRAPRDVGGVAIHTLAARIEEATAEAVEAFLSDKLEEALSLAPVEVTEPEDYEEFAIGSALAPVNGPARRKPAVVARVAKPTTEPPHTNGALADIPVEVETSETTTAAGQAPVAPEADADGEVSPVDEFDEAARMPPVWRDPTVVLAEPGPISSAPVAPIEPVAPDESGTGTFVSALREHMSAVEARLFGPSPEGEAAVDESAPPEIDLDAIGGTTVTREDEAPSPPRPPAAAMTRPRPRPSVTRDLVDEDVASLLGRLARESWSGRVAFRRDDVEKIVLFDEGRPIFASSSLAHDRMGELLVREGKITAEQIERAFEVVTQSGRRMGEILVDLGYLKRRELLPAVRRHVEDILYSLFSWESGSATAVAGGTGREEKIRLAAPPALLVVEGIRRKVGLDRLRRLVGPPATVLVPEKHAELLDALADADLGPEERQTVELFDGERPLGDVLAAAPVGEEHVLQLSWALVALGLARVRDTTTSRAAVAPPAAMSSWPSGAADAAIDRERILAKHAHVRDADYFLVLGVRRDATAFEIRRAYEAARRDYAPAGFAPDLQASLAAELTEIAIVLGEAYRVLHTDPVRRSYLAHLKE